MRLIRVLLASFLLAGGYGAVGELRRGPYLQNQTETSVSVLWATSGLEATGSVEVDGLGTFPAESAPDLVSITRHRARVSGLAPGGDYRYRIRTNGVIQTGWILIDSAAWAATPITPFASPQTIPHRILEPTR
jgi:hypothetical protein